MINYDQDFYGWTHGCLNYLIEEVEAIGRTEKRELEFRLTVLLVHLLKWKFQTRFLP